MERKCYVIPQMEVCKIEVEVGFEGTDNSGAFDGDWVPIRPTSTDGE